ncbi:MAG: peptide chain release factor N(5)-glutamine methyltransferase [Crocinitomicaceae bacterium]
MFLQHNTLDGLRDYFNDALVDRFSESEIKLMFKAFVMKRMSLTETDFMLTRGLSKPLQSNKEGKRQFHSTEVRFSESDLLYFRSVVKRLQAEEPFQYVHGRTEFYGLELICDKRALIPRPETEELVDWIVESSNEEDELRIVDICAGSGCIAFGIKSVLKNAQVEAWELSSEALELINENRKLTGLEINSTKMDALSEGYPAKSNYYDVIVSNPPYIPHSDRTKMEANVLEHEPGMALFVEDDDPFVFYKRIVEEASELLVDGGALYFEIHEDYEKEVIACFEEYPFVNIELRKDLQGRSRMIRGQRVPSRHEQK